MLWDVWFSVYVRYFIYLDVNFFYGWKGFFVVCDFRVGDLLIFFFMEFLEFEVYVFWRIENLDVFFFLIGEN